MVVIVTTTDYVDRVFLINLFAIELCHAKCAKKVAVLLGWLVSLEQAYSLLHSKMKTIAVVAAVKALTIIWIVLIAACLFL